MAGPPKADGGDAKGIAGVDISIGRDTKGTFDGVLQEGDDFASEGREDLDGVGSGGTKVGSGCNLPAWRRQGEEKGGEE